MDDIEADLEYETEEMKLQREDDYQVARSTFEKRLTEIPALTNRRVTHEVSEMVRPYLETGAKWVKPEGMDINAAIDQLWYLVRKVIVDGDKPKGK